MAKSSFNLFRQFQESFPKDRSSPFLETPGGRVWSYADLEAWSARIASFLAASGVKPGDRVMAQVEKSPEAIILYVACLRLGAVYLPLNTAYRRAELAYFLADAEPTVVVCRPEDKDAMTELAAGAGKPAVLTLGTSGDGSLIDGSRGKPTTFADAEREEGDLAALLYTSGTTGRPKGAMLTGGNLMSNARTLHRLWGFRTDDVLVHILPIFHTHGLFVAINCMLLSGGKMLFLPKFDPRQVMALLPKATVLMGVPTNYVRLLAEPGFTAEVCRNMRLFVSGSAPLLEQTFTAFRERSGHTILERYGMTETCMNTSNPLDGKRIGGTVGLPLPGVEVRTAGEDGKILPQGEVGVLEVRGPNVFKGYWRKPEATAADFRKDGYFITGDLACIDENGYVSIVGRAKDLVISGGFNVYPKEVEEVLDAIEGIGESAVIGIAHPDLGEAVCAVVMRAAGAACGGESEIIAKVKNDLANYKVPKRVFFVDELPRNAMGKVQKNLLRDAYKDAFTGVSATT
jgi:malonyl-CoA/methylmalonyl-CoA synthetase